ncbi:probable ubiquitin-conjugating enzyme E2 W-A [Ylistrum balloti]|uniref:probable ubiquitin-conjugating enzyme E2 W-A n=1 Tax=Ylistrum balloti TaxID=509963 RepID=UPI00290593BA|nr:probable ubiquitin-conjugating enzyme E2 W-A [Ylistrum balloti]
MASMEKRLQKELLALTKDPPAGVKVDSKSICTNLSEWTVDLEGAPESIYEGEKFQLMFKFGARYPFESPQKRPPDNAFYVKTCSKNPKKTRWWYHGKIDNDFKLY